MYDLEREIGRVKLEMKAITVGNDLCIIVSGGDKPHIGCVTLSVSRPSLADSKFNSATTSILNLTGHKDDEAAKYVSHTLSSRLNKVVVATCGIHIDNITAEEINVVMRLIKEMTEALVQELLPIANEKKCGKVLEKS